MTDPDWAAWQESMTPVTPEPVQDDVTFTELVKLENAEAALRTELAEIAETLKTAAQEEEQVREAFRVAMLNVKKKNEAARNAKFDKSKELRVLEAQRASVERQLAAQAQREATQRAESDRLAAQADALKALSIEHYLNLKWTEFIKPHQTDGSDFITIRQRMILGDTMGLGKTLTAIAALDKIKFATESASPDSPIIYDDLTSVPVTYPVGRKIIYFAPDSVVGNVVTEFQKFAPHRSVFPLNNMNKLQRRFFIQTVLANMDEFVAVLNYSAWRKDFAMLEDLRKLGIDTAIIDEAHNIKDMKSVGFRGVKTIMPDVIFRIAMTGTPILNKPQEFFALLHIISPLKFRDERQFLEDYCERDWDTNKWRFRPGGVESLYRRVGSIFLRRTKETAGIELPDKTVTYHNLEIDTETYPDQARAREEMRTRAMIMLDPDAGKAITAAAEIAVYTRLRQIETWPAGIIIRDPETKLPILELDVEESQKLDYIITSNGEGLLPEIATDERVVVFSQFKEPLRVLSRRLSNVGISNIVLDGDTSEADREAIRRDFDASYDNPSPKWRVVLCNYKVGGVGLNFTGASQMIILDEEWNPGKRDQAYDRIHRMGQQKPVTIHVLRMMNTVDDWLAGLIAEKEQILGDFGTHFNSGEGLNMLKEGKI